jgi:hypothetical protein
MMSAAATRERRKRMTDTDMLHMAALEKENMELWKLLREIRPNLRRAFYANYEDQDKADELIDKIDKMIGKE